MQKVHVYWIFHDVWFKCRNVASEDMNGVFGVNGSKQQTFSYKKQPRRDVDVHIHKKVLRKIL